MKLLLKDVTGMNRYDESTDLRYKADIYTWRGGGMDEWGNPQPPSKVFIANDLPIDFQPLSGQRRVSSSGTEYSSTHKIYILQPDLLTGDVEEGAKVSVQRDDKVFGNFLVVFEEDHIDHLELEVMPDVT